MKSILTVVLLMAALLCPKYSTAQNVKKEGKTFVQQKNERTKQEPKKTEYTFKANDGKEYPIYLSSKGKAFIIRTSKKTGNEYRQYLPEVTKQLGTQN